MTSSARRVRGQQSPGRLLLDEISPYTWGLIGLLGLASIYGSYDSLADAYGDRRLGQIPLVAPSVVAIWVSFELLWRRTTLTLSHRLFITCILTPLPSVIISTIAWAAFGTSGYGQDLITSTSEGTYDHYYWPRDARGLAAAPLMFFGGWGVAGFMGLMSLLVVVLPLKAFLATRELTAGTHLDPSDASAAAVVRVAFGAMSLGTLAAISSAADGPQVLTVGLLVVTVALLGWAAATAAKLPRS
ncbi:hypothetical protein [Janibacter melonis]|uniref:hypothetical protein n=1 Tax=Janibacter melonis TaxID=262209 RepID=UPI0017839D80